MPWARFDDDYLDSRKLRRAGRHAAWLDFAAVIYCSKNLTDGRIDKNEEDVNELAIKAMMKPSEIHKYASVLCSERVGRWEDHDDHWLIHDYLEYQKSKTEVLRDREKAKLRQRKSRATSQRDSSGDDHSDTERTDGVSSLTPSRPVPSRRGTSDNKSSPLASVPPVDNLDGEVRKVLAAIVKRKLDVHRPRYPESYKEMCWKTVDDEYGIDVARAVAMFPGAPPQSIAAHVLGESVPSLANYRKGA